jgi:hypothetical protein
MKRCTDIRGGRQDTRVVSTSRGKSINGSHDSIHGTQVKDRL